MRRERQTPSCFIELTFSGSTAEGYLPCIIGDDIKFDAKSMHSYFAKPSDVMIYDCLLVAAAVDYCDHSKKRPTHDWAREFHVRIPVHNVEIWRSREVSDSLNSALSLLTGDIWNFEFLESEVTQSPLDQIPLDLDVATDAVVPFSDGLDSRAVSAILDNELGDKIVRVRLSTKKINDAPKQNKTHIPFTAVPYKVRRLHKESSGRSRGFRFAVISGLAGYLLGARRIVVPESGQGAIGPALINVGQSHPDFRTHPRFTQKMSDFLECILGKRPMYDHPTIWKTKGQTVSLYKEICPGDDSWRSTRSCWQSAQQVSIEGRHRQCGVCAACMLRRLSLHTAGLEEEVGTYVWDDLSVSDFWESAHPDLTKRHRAFKEYGLAGTLHMDHLAKLRNAPQFETVLARHSLFLARNLDLEVGKARENLDQLLIQHSDEWNAFLASLGRTSFVKKWATNNE